MINTAAPFPPLNMTEFIDMFTYANTITDNWWGIGMLFVIFVVVYTWIRSMADNEGAILISMFMVDLSAMIMMSLGLIDGETLTIVVVLTVVSFVYYRFFT